MFTGLYNLIVVAGIVILTLWNSALFITQFLKECNTGKVAERVNAFIQLFLIYTKQAVLAGFGVMALAFSTEVFQENSIGTWIITLAILGFSGSMFYYFYPQFVDFDEAEKRESVSIHTKTKHL
ncbi:hypothetical protein [Domibacillus robiginosus]|uniref:hypothetical protein n=1 Tax=Domibacillus robiginosus TaxID=1071054 RepID=UPI00067D82E6|nr:hypothetical protein [Domibacillus robiginosus]